jgi:nucleoside-diphosphate-sugar epimerase
MNLLFIGGTGNISTECAVLLHQRGQKILVLSRGKNPVPPEYSSIVTDRKDLTAMRVALKGIQIDVVLNFIGYDIPELQVDYEVFKDSIKQYVFISSATVYAKPPKSLPITEDSPLGNDWWDYAQRKLACEQWLQKRWSESKFPITIVRPSHTYSKHWIPSLISSSTFSLAARLEQHKPVFVPDNGENPWTLTSASDFAVGFAGLVGNPAALGQALHITSDEVLTWNQIYLEIANAVGVASPQIFKIPTDFICQVAPELIGPFKGDKVHPGVFDNSKLKRLAPDFKCQKPFHAGIRESVAWLRAHPDQQNLKPEMDATIDRIIAAWQAK